MRAANTLSGVVVSSTPWVDGMHLVLVKPERGPNIGLRTDAGRRVGEHVQVRGFGRDWELVR